MSKAFEKIRNTDLEQLRARWSKLATCIDMHTGGEPLRVVIDGTPPLTGTTILAKRRQMIEQFDSFRKLLMWEPRGHADMYGCLLLPPERPDSDFGVLFMHNEGYSTMCGHATLAIAKRKGAGKLRHIRVSALWIQEKQDREDTTYAHILGTDNPADLMTKHLV